MLSALQDDFCSVFAETPARSPALPRTCIAWHMLQTDTEQCIDTNLDVNDDKYSSTILSGVTLVVSLRNAIRLRSSKPSFGKRDWQEPLKYMGLLCLLYPLGDTLISGNRAWDSRNDPLSTGCHILPLDAPNRTSTARTQCVPCIDRI